MIHIPAELAPARVDYLPMIRRPRIEWPDGARVAFWIAPNIEHYEYLPPRDPKRNPWVRTPHPEVQGYSQRDYGNRVGGHFSAEADRYFVLGRGLQNTPYLDKHRRVDVVVAGSHSRVIAVQRQQILTQVI